jgi:hypothetical protein
MSFIKSKINGRMSESLLAEIAAFRNLIIAYRDGKIPPKESSKSHRELNMTDEDLAHSFALFRREKTAQEEIGRIRVRRTFRRWSAVLIRRLLARSRQPAIARGNAAAPAESLESDDSEESNSLGHSASEIVIRTFREHSSPLRNPS